MDDIAIHVRVPSELIKKIDELAEQERRTRSNMIRVLLEIAIGKAVK